MLNYSWKASPNRSGCLEFNASFSIGFWNGLNSVNSVNLVLLDLLLSWLAPLGTSGILYRWIHTCTYMVHKPMCNAYVCTYTMHASTCMYVSWIVQTRMYMVHSLQSIYMYVHGIYIDVRVSACVYMYIPCTLHTSMYMYGPDSYVHECISQYVQ